MTSRIPEPVSDTLLDRAGLQALYARARKAAAHGQFGDAILYYSEMIAVNSANEQALLGRATMRALRGNNSDALNDAATLLGLPTIKNSTRVLAHVVEIMARRNLAQYEDSITAADAARQAIAPIADGDKTLLANLMAQINIHYTLTLLEQQLDNKIMGDVQDYKILIEAVERALYDAKYAKGYGLNALAIALHGAVLTLTDDSVTAESRFQQAENLFSTQNADQNNQNYQYALLKYIRGIAAHDRTQATTHFRAGIALCSELAVNYSGLIKVNAATDAELTQLDTLRHDPPPRADLMGEATRDFAGARTRFVLVFGGLLLVLATIFLLLFR